MIPQTPGPHITEVRLKFQLEKAGRAPGRYRVSYRYQTEYYMHPFGPADSARLFSQQSGLSLDEGQRRQDSRAGNRAIWTER